MKQYTYSVTKIDRNAADVVVIDMADKKGRPVFDFKPGQYVMVSYKNEKGVVPDKHAFSIASAPSQKDRLTLGIKILGNFTQGIAKLKVGDDIFVSGPFGDFVFDDKKHKDLVMIAGGIGITPFMSAMRYATDTGLPNKLSLLYSNRTLAGTLFMQEIREMQERNANLRALFSVTDEALPGNAPDIIGERLSGQVISETLGGFDGKTFFLCGPKGFMEAMKNELRVRGATADQIAMEEFSMIPDSGFWVRMKNLSYATGFAGLAMLLPFYFIYQSAFASELEDAERDDVFLSRFYNEAKLYDITRTAYERMLGDPEIALSDGVRSFAADDAIREEDESENKKTFFAAPSTARAASITPNGTKTSVAAARSQTAVASAPAPVTSASSVTKAPAATAAPVAVTNAPASQVAAVVQPPAPQPVTSASVTTPAPTASAAPSVPVTQPAPAAATQPVVTAPAPAPVPVPTTSTSVVSHPATPVPAPAQPITQPAATRPTAPVVTMPVTPTRPVQMPAPVTSVSGVVTQPAVPAIPSAPIVRPTAPIQTPVIRPTTPAPITSVSGAVTQPSTGTGGYYPTYPSILPEYGYYYGDDDDDHYDDDDDHYGGYYGYYGYGDYEDDD